MFDDTPFWLPVPLGAELAMHEPHHWSRPSCPACPICPLPHLPLPTAAPGAYASEVKYEQRHDRETYKKEEGYTHEDKKEYAPKEYSGEYDKYDYNYKSRDKPPKEYKEDYGPPPYNPKAYENYEYDRCRLGGGCAPIGGAGTHTTGTTGIAPPHGSGSVLEL